MNYIKNYKLLFSFFKMTESKEFYFSNPLSLKENTNVEVPLVMMALKEEYDENGSLDYSYEKYLDLLEMVDFMVEAEENIFEPYDLEVSVENLKLKLLGMGFIHNPKLDSELEKYIKEKEIEANKKLFYAKRARKIVKTSKKDDSVDEN